MSKFYRHMAEATQTDHSYFLALRDIPMAHGRVSGYACAQERRRCREFEVGWNPQYELFIDDDAIGVATVSDPSQIFVRAVVGEYHVRTKLLKARFAIWAGAVRIDQAADRSEIAGLVLGNFRTDLGHTADDFMARDNRVNRGHDTAPLVTNLVKIGVADAAEQDFDPDIVFGRFPSRNRGGSQRRCGTGSGISFRVVRGWMHLVDPPIGLFLCKRTPEQFGRHGTRGGAGCTDVDLQKIRTC
jgi:hypothetical protein